MKPTAEMLEKAAIADLQAWLAAATYRLCDEAVERITGEIREHFINAAEAARRDGLATGEAYDHALASLGDPKQAAREFRRTNLTRFQARLVYKDYEIWWPLWLRGIGFIVFYTLVFLVLSSMGTTLDRVFFGSLFVSVAILTLFTHLLHRRGWVRSAALLETVSVWGALVAINAFLHPAARNGESNLPLYVSVVLFAIHMALLLPALRKMRREPAPVDAHGYR